jgi:hypothetical protein
MKLNRYIFIDKLHEKMLAVVELRNHYVMEE